MFRRFVGGKEQIKENDAEKQRLTVVQVRDVRPQDDSMVDFEKYAAEPLQTNDSVASSEN